MVESSVSPERVRHHAAIARFVSHLNGLQRFAERSDLVHLDQNSVRNPLLDPVGDAHGVRHKHVVADDLDSLASSSVINSHPAKSSSAMPSSMETMG